MNRVKKILLTVSLAGALVLGAVAFDNSTAQAGKCYGSYSNGMDIVPCE